MTKRQRLQEEISLNYVSYVISPTFAEGEIISIGQQNMPPRPLKEVAAATFQSFPQMVAEFPLFADTHLPEQTFLAPRDRKIEWFNLE